jgi:uncharacterized protein YggE
MKIALATLATLIVAGVAQANVSITGHGKATFVPNMAYVHASVSNDAKTAAEAWQKTSDAVKGLFGVLKDFGVDEKDFKTAGLNVSPRYIHPKDKEPVLVGYTVSYDLQITMRQLSRLGAMLDQLVANGANRGMGVSFSHDQLDQLIEEARLAAVTDARQRAEKYVRAAGGSLGVLLSISEFQPVQPRMYRLEHAPASGDAGLPIAGGQQDLNASIVVTYTINNNLSRP